MQGFLKIFSETGLAPHGFCLLWQPDLILLHVISDAVIGISYYAIPLTLVYFLWKSKGIAFGWIFAMFAAFILACGTTHLFEIWTLWHPDYGAQGLLKAFTALISVITAIALFPLVPRALALPSPAELGRVNDELSVQIRERNQAVAGMQKEIRDREAAEAALRQAQKMEAVGQLTGGIAHDFNNLLTVIIGNMELMRRRLPDADLESRQYLDTARMGADRAAELTHQLLAFSRRQPLAPKPLNANKLVAGMSDLLRRTLGESIAIETVLAGGLWMTSTDPNQLENALLNLAVNARDAMSEGGKLSIETANVYLDEAYCAGESEVTPGQYVMMAVTDTGMGISKDMIAKVFEPFFTTKIVGKGTGLGLSQVYGFVRQSGGHVKIYSEAGEGTTVKIYLPRSLGEEVAAPRPEAGVIAAPPAEIPQNTALRGQTVLVVEDNPDVRAYAGQILSELGFEVLEAPDGRTALRLLDETPDIDLLFTDVGLPGGMNGRQLSDEARRRRPDLKVLFTTGYARNAIVHQGRLDPGVELIVKPYTYSGLAAKVQQMLEDEG